MGRRNITETQRNYLVGVQYSTEKKIIERDESGRFAPSGQNVQTVTRKEQQEGTAGRIGKEYGMSGRTVRRNGEFSQAVDTLSEDSPEIRPMILSGKIRTEFSI